MDFGFLLNRLSRMSFFEIIFRVKQKIQLEIEDRFLVYNKITPVFTNIKNNELNLKYDYLNKTWIKKNAEDLCKNKLDIFSMKKYYLGKQINYHKDYKSGLCASSNKLGKKFNYRDINNIGDIKYIWEPNRHLFFLNLVLAYKITNNVKYLNKFYDFLNSWLKQNIFMLGANWCSSLEIGIRLINWTLCFIVIEDTIDEKFKDRWLEETYRHCWFIEKNLSAFSSANNHLIGEAAGLFIASSAIPYFQNSEKWQEKAYKILVSECEKQNYIDGVNKEQATSYQQFVLDFLLISGLIGKRFDKEFPPEYWERIEKMMEFLAALEDCSGNIPQIGDEDDGLVIDLGQREYGIYRSILNTGAYLFNRRDFLKLNGVSQLDDKTKFLLNLAGINFKHKPVKIKSVPKYFPEGGYYILGTEFNRKYEQKLIFDCGKLGYLSIAAHGHADALSFVMSAGGEPLFIDPGTYNYHADRSWRDYFRSTAAHNTLTIDDLDQSVITGSFMWSRKAQAELIEYIGNSYAKGTHDGYMRLKDRVRHNRSIEFDIKENTWKITDEILCKSRHNVSIFFHITPGCDMKKRKNSYDIDFKKGICTIYIQPDMSPTLFRGGEENFGWCSPSYDIKTPATTLRLSKIINGNTKIVTKFQLKFKLK
jgi:CRISPR/Cas system CSM-associated protein Csm2 small subunit